MTGWKFSPLSELETWLTLNVLPTLRDKDIEFKYQEQAASQSSSPVQSYKISNIFALLWYLIEVVGGQKICNLDTTEQLQWIK